MMKHMSLAEIATACGGTYVGDDSLKTVEVNGVVIDSRKVEPGYLFVAVKGERVDGHTFIPSVFAKSSVRTRRSSLPDPISRFLPHWKPSRPSQPATAAL